MGVRNIGKLSYEHKTLFIKFILHFQISSGGDNKPAIMMECGIHAREWSSVAACIYLVNKVSVNFFQALNLIPFSIYLLIVEK